jgi:U6 snRNA-associated Sm-like protein LSm6
MEESAQHSSAESKVEAPAKKSPSDFLKQVLGKPVIVQLNSGVTYRGILACLDGFLNIAMEQTEEYVDGQLKNRYGDCFIRGNNGKMQLCPILYMSYKSQRLCISS